MNVSVRKHITGGSAVEVARSIEGAIREGRLGPGDRLPTVRALARDLALSPTTVASAYRTLRQRGLLIGQGRRGTAVSPAPALATRVAAPVPARARDLAAGNPDPALLPRLGSLLASIDPTPHLYGGPLKSSRLLALAKRQLAADGIATDAIAVVGGALDGIERVLAAHLRPGDRVAVEDPGFTSVLDLLGALGLAPVPAAIDDAGPIPESLDRALARGAQALIVTPRAQNPSGAALDERRARELRRVLRRYPEVLLIEDDHAAGVAGAPFLTLCERRRARWAVVRSVSKSLGPDLRLAVLAGDPETVARVEGRQLRGIRWVSHLLQRLVVALWSDPATTQQLRRAERSYARRRGALLDALAARGIAAHGRSGLNVWIPVPEEASAVQALLERGWAVGAGSRFRLESAPAIRATIATLQPREAQRFADDVARSLRPSEITTTA